MTEEKKRSLVERVEPVGLSHLVENMRGVLSKLPYNFVNGDFPLMSHQPALYTIYLYPANKKDEISKINFLWQAEVKGAEYAVRCDFKQNLFFISSSNDN